LISLPAITTALFTFGNGVKNNYFTKNVKAWVFREITNFSEKRARCFKNQIHENCNFLFIAREEDLMYRLSKRELA